jgi:hypothetical protein
VGQVEAVWDRVSPPNRWLAHSSMSALGHEQTSFHVRVMFIIPLKADIHQRGFHVRLVPQADMLAQLLGLLV